jgi:hypothetical protein
MIILTLLLIFINRLFPFVVYCSIISGYYRKIWGILLYFN